MDVAIENVPDICLVQVDNNSRMVDFIMRGYLLSSSTLRLTRFQNAYNL